MKQNNGNKTIINFLFRLNNKILNEKILKLEFIY